MTQEAKQTSIHKVDNTIETDQFKVSVEITGNARLRIMIDDKRFPTSGNTIIDKYRDIYSNDNLIRIATDAQIRKV